MLPYFKYFIVLPLLSMAIVLQVNAQNANTNFATKDGTYLDKIADVNFNFVISNTSDSINLKFENLTNLTNNKLMVMKSYNGSYFASIHEEIITNNQVISMVSTKSPDKPLYYKLLLVNTTTGQAIDSSKIITVFGVNAAKCTIYPSKNKGEVLADLDQSLKGHTPRIIVTDANTGVVLLSKTADEIKQTDKFKVLSGKDKLSPGSYNVSLAFKRETFSQRIEVR